VERSKATAAPSEEIPCSAYLPNARRGVAFYLITLGMAMLRL